MYVGARKPGTVVQATQAWQQQGFAKEQQEQQHKQERQQTTQAGVMANAKCGEGVKSVPVGHSQWATPCVRGLSC